jgi:hypothetical protein
MTCALGTSRLVLTVGAKPYRSPTQLTAMRIAGRDQQNAPATRADAQQAPSHPTTARGRPTAHLHCTHPAQLVAALAARTANPRGSSFWLARVTPLAVRARS